MSLIADPTAVSSADMAPAVSAAAGVAVIGAGIAGLACARRLAGQGVPVRIFDKSPGLGGRLATRRAEMHSFDHGAQYFTARDQHFAVLVDGWIAAGVAAAWTGEFVTLGRDSPARSAISPTQAGPRYVGLPGMSAIGRHLGADLAVATGTRITRLTRSDEKWQLAGIEDIGTEDIGTEASDFGLYDRIVIAIPSVQAAKLLRLAAPAMAERAAAVRMAGCWAVMAAYGEPLDLGFAGAFVDGSPLAWIAAEATKPGRVSSTGPETIVLHAGGTWSDAHLEDPPERVVASLLEAFAAAVGRPLPAPAYVAAHRWRHARPIAPLGVDAIVEPALGLALCGDWVLGARVEEAYLSGLAAADRLLGS